VHIKKRKELIFTNAEKIIGYSDRRNQIFTKTRKEKMWGKLKRTLSFFHDNKRKCPSLRTG
jgi:hypothetical protein